MAIGCAESLPFSFEHPFSFKQESCYPFDYQTYNKLLFYERFYAKCIFFFKNICTISVFVVTLQAKNLEHKFERNTILEYEKVIYNSFTDAIIS